MAIVEAHSLAQVKDVSERIGNLPALGQPRRQCEVILTADEPFEDQLADALALRVGANAGIEIERRAFDQHDDRARLRTRVRAASKRKACQRKAGECEERESHPHSAWCGTPNGG